MNLTPVRAAKGRATARSRQDSLFHLWLERYIATGAGNASQALRDVVGTKKGSDSRLRIRAAEFAKRAEAEGLIEQRIAKVKKAMGVDEILERLSAQARAEDPATAGLTEIADKADMGEFMARHEYQGPGPDGAPLEPTVNLDLAAAHAKGLLRYVRSVRPTAHGLAIEIENRADVLKAVASIQKGALDTLAKIHGLGERPPDDRPSLAAMAALLAMIPAEVRVRIHRAEVMRLRGAPVDIEAEDVD